MRVKNLSNLFIIIALLTITKLFYVQVISHEKYLVEAESQHLARYKIPSNRGEILTADNYPLVSDKKAYLVYLSLKEFRKVATKSANYAEDTIFNLANNFWDYDQKIKIKKEKELPPEASQSGDQKSIDQIKEDEVKKLTASVISKVSDQKLLWIPLKRKVDEDLKTKIESFQVPGLGFQEISVRSYPEATLSAQTVGFVGLDSADENRGYLGLEGYYDGELKGREGFLKQEIDAEGRPILVGKNSDTPALEGSNLYTNIDRTAQFIIEKKLDEGIKKYGAQGGTIVVLNPLSGAVLASASRPTFNPEHWDQYRRDELVDPATAVTYEPGSTFKLITYSAGLDEGLVIPETTCGCAGPIILNGFTVRTWDNKYHANSTVVEGLQNSDNIVTSFVAQKLGSERLYKYIKRFGFGELTNVDLQGEQKGIINDPAGWQDIDLATASFGQGLAVTPLQMVRAVAAIANKGQLMQPYVVNKVTSQFGDIKKEKRIDPIFVRQVLKPTTAQLIKEMMVRAVENGESKFFLPKGMKVAGKTGTAQIPVEGKYDPNKYTASFVGFAPADKPKFVMLVKYDRPSASIYGSTTAAPTFFEIAKELYTYWGIPYEE